MAPILPGISDGEEQIRRLTGACLTPAPTTSARSCCTRSGVREHCFWRLI
jgi:hypothetical protein